MSAYRQLNMYTVAPGLAGLLSFLKIICVVLFEIFADSSNMFMSVLSTDSLDLRCDLYLQ